MRFGNRLVPSKMKIYLTGVDGRAGVSVGVVIGDKTMLLSNVALIEPGIYTADFEMLTTLDAGGNLPVVVTGTVGTTAFSSRQADTGPYVYIL